MIWLLFPGFSASALTALAILTYSDGHPVLAAFLAALAVLNVLAFILQVVEDVIIGEEAK